MLEFFSVIAQFAFGVAVTMIILAIILTPAFLLTLKIVNFYLKKLMKE